MELSEGLYCEIAPVYDDDGVYAGTLVLLPIGAGGEEVRERPKCL